MEKLAIELQELQKLDVYVFVNDCSSPTRQPGI